jgi:glycosyltransferase involved in cell wall biosynthesis
MMPETIIWVTWENQRRNRELSKSLGIKLYQLDHIDKINNKISKYVTGIKETFSIYWKERPRVIFCQNPSIVLSLFTVVIKTFLKSHVIIDAHNAGLFPAEGRSKILSTISRFIQRKADLTIISNKNLQPEVIKNGGTAFVLPDKIPDIPLTPKRTLKGKNNLLLICSFADDEPSQIVFDTVLHLDKNICIYVSGNYRKKNIKPESFPENIILTGFMSETEYIQMLNSVDATIVLTTRENCLVCGAYESVAAGKPIILSNTKALIEYFSCGAVYVDHNVNDMKRAIMEVLGKKNDLSGQIRHLKTDRHQQWLVLKDELKELIRRLTKDEQKN